MANHLDKFLEQIQRQGIAVTLVVFSCFAGYYIMQDQITLFKDHAVLIRDDNKYLLDQLLECLKK